VSVPCAVCGEPARVVARAGARGARTILCPRCRYRLYDYPRSCVGFVVARGADVLLLTRGHQPKRGWLDLPGGFLEAGEDFERAARRELREETGLTVGTAKLLGIYWDEYPLPGFGRFPTINWYYFARWRSGTPVAADDAASAEWVPLAAALRPERRRRFSWRHMERVLRDARGALAAPGLRRPAAARNLLRR
jgi:8-oxo-dGTP diphosphatase